MSFSTVCRAAQPLVDVYPTPGDWTLVRKRRETPGGSLLVVGRVQAFISTSRLDCGQHGSYNMDGLI
jgi:hypothetical protein